MGVVLEYECVQNRAVDQEEFGSSVYEKQDRLGLRTLPRTLLINLSERVMPCNEVKGVQTKRLKRPWHLSS